MIEIVGGVNSCLLYTSHDDFFHRAFAPQRDLVYLVDASCASLRGQYGRTDEQ